MGFIVTMQMQREEGFCEMGRSYYAILGVSADSSDEEIRRAYRKLAMQWHPDKWTRKNPSLLGEANRKFQQIQEAYSVLSDPRKKTMYDAGLYDPEEDDDDEGFADFLQEMVSLMDNVRKENKIYTMEELQGMFWEMADGFETTEWSSPLNWFQEPFTFHGSPATSSAAAPWSSGEKSMGASAKAPCSTTGNSWSKSFAHFCNGQRVL